MANRQTILSVFHDSFVKKLWLSVLFAGGGNLSVKNRDTLNRTYTISCNIAVLCTPDTSLEPLYKSRTLQMANKSAPTLFFLHD